MIIHTRHKLEPCPGPDCTNWLGRPFHYSIFLFMEFCSEECMDRKEREFMQLDPHPDPVL